MTTITRPASLAVSKPGAAPLDIADALGLLSAVVDDQRSSSSRPVSTLDVTSRAKSDRSDGEPCIVGCALSFAGVSAAALGAIRNQSMRDLHRNGRLPIPITLGALIVFDAAQRSQASGRRWADVLDDADAAAAKFLDLVHVVSGVVPPLGCCNRRCPLRLGN